MSIATKRLMSEQRELSRHPVQGIAAGPISSKNLFEWEAYIRGPEATPFEKGTFRATLSFPRDYPMSPPKMKFTTPVFHPNVFPDGNVCISILHPPGDDPTGYESASERWSPVQSVEKILLSVLSMLAEPNCDSPANVDAAKLYRENRREYNRRAEQASLAATAATAAVTGVAKK
ncbi:putative ubiquitin-conjugating enzyme [Monocercomonoides exilis]|uniref:putative ubiquitin-conjugating enzyme n=1 Tax=Monocercomonoides exilis TaxID=2049356 RepID=UPI00355A25C4|nr:putative ubiquitin-conjugating enzyme [Monocercomonoides exilis]|eukprot:MONOS_8579.1-p1 / transcript=MONOS_8579.1 / gene=MONOS_8579 / organism=Monocercomonoides_exilis_PA203 / gene_product=Zgc / transcript_product=Zgc / location=Mono_scaffold00327:6488-7296(+) / protein_length=174 / sequence_SO=supercontig / SO=protein_coding / is_pseudo=false